MLVSAIMNAEHKVAALTASFLVVLGACSLLSVKRAPFAESEQVVTLKLPKAAPLQVQAVAGPLAKRGSGSDLAKLIVPVDGVSRSSLRDTWGAPRDSGRTHKGIDIMAEQGTPVLAAASGRIIKLFESEKGGTTIYQTDESGKFIFYYAHLERYVESLRVGQRVRQGDTIAYVGETGNAPVPHLHFEIQTQSAGRKWWRGIAMNPYPVLAAGPAATVGRSVQARMK